MQSTCIPNTGNIIEAIAKPRTIPPTTTDHRAGTSGRLSPAPRQGMKQQKQCALFCTSDRPLYLPHSGRLVTMLDKAVRPSSPASGRRSSGVLGSIRSSLSLKSVIGPNTIPKLAAGIRTKYPEKEYGRWRNILGSGAGGTVRLVKRPKDGVIYAVKEFRPIREGESDRHYVDKVAAEFCVGSTLKHINIIKTIDMFHHEKRYFQVFEYAPYDLFSVTVAGKMSHPEVYCIFRQIVDGADYLHNLGLAHRDLKLDNCVMMADNTIKIIDFGTAAVFHSPGNKKMSASGLVGSDPYLAPEVLINSKSYDPRLADVWSLGVIFLCLYLRRFPWKLPDPQKDECFRLFAEEHPELIEPPQAFAEAVSQPSHFVSPTKGDSRRDSFHFPPPSAQATSKTTTAAAPTGPHSGLLPAFDPEKEAVAERNAQSRPACELVASPLSRTCTSSRGANETPNTIPSTACSARSSVGLDKASVMPSAYPSAAPCDFIQEASHCGQHRALPATCPAPTREPVTQMITGRARGRHGCGMSDQGIATLPAARQTASSTDAIIQWLPCSAAPSPPITGAAPSGEMRAFKVHLGQECLAPISLTSSRGAICKGQQSPKPCRECSSPGLQRDFPLIPTVSEAGYNMDGFHSPLSNVDTLPPSVPSPPHAQSGSTRSAKMPHKTVTSQWESVRFNDGFSAAPANKSLQTTLCGLPHGTTSDSACCFQRFPKDNPGLPRRKTEPTTGLPAHSGVHFSKERRNTDCPVLGPSSPWHMHNAMNNEFLHKSDSLLSLCPVEVRSALRRMLAINPSMRCTLGDLLRGPLYADALSPLSHLPGEPVVEPPEGTVGSSTFPGAPCLSPKKRCKPVAFSEKPDVTKGDPWLTTICTCSFLLQEGKGERPTHTHHHPERPQVFPEEPPIMPKSKSDKRRKQ